MNSDGLMPRMAALLLDLDPLRRGQARVLSRSSRFSSGDFLGRAIHARRSAGPSGVSRGVSPLARRPARAGFWVPKTHLATPIRIRRGWLRLR